MSQSLLPPRPDITYLEHQKDGVSWMLQREDVGAPLCRGGILADDMGLGKTFQCIGLLKNSPFKEWRTLIVCPPALIAGWTHELQTCGVPVHTLIAGSPTWTGGGSVPPGAVGLTTFPKVCQYSRCLAEQKFNRIVLDEGHAIRNKNARHDACAAVAADASSRWILSATPIQNAMKDWRNLLSWLHCPPTDVESDCAQTIMLRRTMSELRSIITALPPPAKFIDHNLHMSPGPELRLFKALCDQLDSVMDSKTVSSFIKLELYLRIQQFLVHPQIYIDAMRAKFKGAYPRPDWNSTATKWDECMSVLNEGVASSIGQIVFCQFTAQIERVVYAARNMGAHVWTIQGGMCADDVADAVTDARKAAESGLPVVVVVQIISGGAGLNLQFCSRILFLSSHWNPAVVHQACGRAVRIGQKKIVEIHFFQIVDDCLDNLDRRMTEIHLTKVSGAKNICDTLYEGFHISEEFPLPAPAPAEE